MQSDCIHVTVFLYTCSAFHVHMHVYVSVQSLSLPPSLPPSPPDLSQAGQEMEDSVVAAYYVLVLGLLAKHNLVSGYNKQGVQS